MIKLKGPFCQSCGLPVSQETVTTQKNLTTYCSECFQNGNFSEPNITAIDMCNRVKAKLKELKVPPLIAIVIIRSIPRLKRWCNNAS
jgi:hypothetical protein